MTFRLQIFSISTTIIIASNGMTFRTITFSRMPLTDWNSAEWHSAEWHSAEWHSAEWHSAEWHSAEDINGIRKNVTKHKYTWIATTNVTLNLLFCSSQFHLVECLSFKCRGAPKFSFVSRRTSIFCRKMLASWSLTYQTLQLIQHSNAILLMLQGLFSHFHHSLHRDPISYSVTLQ